MGLRIWVNVKDEKVLEICKKYKVTPIAGMSPRRIALLLEKGY